MLRNNVKSQRRSHTDIVAEILLTACNGVKKTQIVYGANLNFKLVNRYLDQLEKTGLITKNIERTGVVKTTERGAKYLKYYSELKSFEKIMA
jgi:predicted transcriptional regulator